MIPLLIVGGLAAFYLLLESAQKTASGKNTSGTPGVSIGQAPGNYNFGTGLQQALGTDTSIQTGFNDAAKVAAGIPVAGALVAGVLKIGSEITGMFTQAHAAAVVKEAKTVNEALPTFIAEISQVVGGLNQGALSPAQALTYLDQAQADYYLTVGGIIKGRWAYQGSQYPEPTWSDSYAQRGGPYGSKNPNPDSHAPDPCNAACVLGHYFIDRTVFGLKQVIQQGGGTVQIESFPNNGAIKGTPPVTLTYTPYQPQNLATGFLSSIGSLI